MQNDKYLKVAIQAAKESGKIFKQYFGNAGKVSTKNGDPRNLVTKIDHKIEAQIRELILKNFSGHKIIGEEFGSHKISQNDFIWIIDPIDGTVNFIHGLPLCCISIALWDKHGPLVGVVYNPILDYLFTAVRGGGAFLNGKKIHIAGKNPKQTLGGFGWGRNPQNAAKNFPVLIKELQKIRALGSSTLELAFVAQGIYDFHIQAEINVWDFAASILLIQEAGGTASDWQGKKLTLDSTYIVGSNKSIHKKLVKTLSML